MRLEQEKHGILPFIHAKDRLTGKPKNTNPNPKFEPFEAPQEEQEGKLFVNTYHGHYASHMELNRKAIEKALKLAHLDGQVFLGSLSLSRGRSLDANSDGSVSGKKSLFFGEKLDEEKDNPYSRVTSIPQGWKIEINDQRMMEELLEKRISPEKRQKIFISGFNSLIINGIGKAIAKEKLSSIKGEQFGRKLVESILPAGIAVFTSLAIPLAIPFFWALNNVVFNFPLRRKVDHPWEIIMPRVEIDKVVEAFVYLNTFGQTLVRKKNQSY